MGSLAPSFWHDARNEEVMLRAVNSVYVNGRNKPFDSVKATRVSLAAIVIFSAKYIRFRREIIKNRVELCQQGAQRSLHAGNDSSRRGDECHRRKGNIR